MANEFNYCDLSKPIDDKILKFLSEACPDMMGTTHASYFPGYKYEEGISNHHNKIVGEGCYVYEEQEDKSCENCEYRDLHGLTKPCTDCQKHEEWQPRVDMHLRAYGGLT